MSARKKGLFHLTSLLLAAMIFLSFPHVVFAAVSATPVTATVRVGEHADHTRLVFDFSKLTAYHANSETGQIVLSFDTPAQLTPPGGRTGLVQGMTVEAGDDGTKKVTISIPENAHFKTFRLLKKIVVDVFPGKETDKTAPSKPIAPKQSAQKTDKPAAAPVAPLDIKPAVTAAPPEEKKKTEETPPVRAAAAPTAPAPAKKVEPVTTAPMKPLATAAAPQEVSPSPAAQDVTRIVIAPIEATNIAVFTRFHTLWIVMDATSTGTILPDVNGPLKDVLGASKTLRFKNGIAFRYNIPPDQTISVLKHSLTWNIAIARTAEREPPAMDISIELDSESQTAHILAPVKGAGQVLSFQDPSIGDTLYVVPVSYPTEQNPEGRRFTDLEILPSISGLVVRPLRDGINVSSLQNEVLITAPAGLTATLARQKTHELSLESLTIHDDEKRLFDFPAWQQGGITRLYENKRAIEAAIAAALPEDQAALMMKLALLYFANNFGQETLGMLRLISERDPEIAKSPNFVALRGAAAAMAGHYDDALHDLSMPAIQQHPETSLWRGFAAAATEQWHMANRSFPKDDALLGKYPDNISIPFTIYMAESALRLGNNDAAEALLDSLNAGSPDMSPHYRAAMDYLKGETYRQRGKIEDARALWEPVANGLDRLYHAKASLALANLELQGKTITPEEALDRIDSLRFAWRGDGLEVQILHNLGLMQALNQDYLQSLQTMSAAAGLADSLFSDATPIRDDIRRIFTDIFIGPLAGKISPLEAISIYNEFSGLLPPGEDGTVAALHFADYLISMDLIDKAATILEEQLAAGLSDKQTLETGVKLAAVYLLDGRPKQALSTLDRTTIADIPAAQAEERALLRARSQSQLNLTDAAVATLAPLTSRNAGKLRADVLWHARRWEAAADAMTALVPPSSQILDEESARLIINSAVGYKLAGNVAKLRELKNRYESAIEKSPLASTFGVVTRESGGDSLADRETILKIANEVDMFKGFLDNYKKMSGTGSDNGS